MAFVVQFFIWYCSTCNNKTYSLKLYFISSAELLIHYFPFSFQNDIFGSLNDSSLLSRASEALVAVDMKHPVSASQASQLANAAGAIAAGHISSAASQAAFSQIKVLLILYFHFLIIYLCYKITSMRKLL